MNTPEYSQEEVYREHPVYSNIVGIFRDRSQATQAMEDLKQTGIEEDQMQLGEYDPQPDEAGMLVAAAADDPALRDTGRRFLVHIQASGREQEAVGILAQHGANNSDVPTGTRLVQGRLIRSHTNADVVEHPID